MAKQRTGNDNVILNLQQINKTSYVTFNEGQGTVAVDFNCPDGSNCNDKQTCSEISPEPYGCCPAERAVCRDDYSCCPQATDPAAMDTQSLTQTPISPRETVEINDLHSSTVAVGIDYPDGTNCKDKQTCCEISPESYSCCSAEHTVYCDDYSCYPQSYKFAGNFSVEATDPAPMHTPSLTQAPISPRETVEINDSPSSTETVDILCPDGSSCNDKQTCCQISPEPYSCFPAEHAVCRDDYSCCPQANDPAPMHTPSLTQAPISPRETVEINDSPSSPVAVDIDCPDGSSCKDK